MQAFLTRNPDNQGIERMASKGSEGKQQTRWESLACLVAVIFVIFMALFIYTGPWKKYKQAESQLDELKQRVAQLNDAKKSESARLQGQEQVTAQLRERKPDFDLWSFMNGLLTETNLKNRANLENAKPRGEKREALTEVAMVQLRLTGVTLGELVDLLHKVYASKDLIVLYRMDHLRTAGDNKGLDCDLTFMTPRAPATPAPEPA